MSDFVAPAPHHFVARYPERADADVHPSWRAQRFVPLGVAATLLGWAEDYCLGCAGGRLGSLPYCVDCADCSYDRAEAAVVTPEELRAAEPDPAEEAWEEAEGEPEREQLWERYLDWEG